MRVSRASEGIAGFGAMHDRVVHQAIESSTTPALSASLSNAAGGAPTGAGHPHHRPEPAS